MAFPTYEGAGSFVEEQDDSIDVGYPPGIVAGYLIFLFVANRQESASIGSINAPAGWEVMHNNLAFRDAGTVLHGTVGLFYKKATGSESGFQTVTRTGGTGVGTAIGGQMFLVDGRAIENSSANHEEAGGTINWDPVTISGFERTLLAFCAQATSDVSGTPATFTNADNNGTIINLAMSYKENVSSDGAISASGGSADGWAAVQVSVFNPTARNYIPDH